MIVNFGSLNIDHVYRVDRFANRGETVATLGYEVFAGGKGFNQSVALARAGTRVAHAGRVGSDGARLVDALVEEGIDVRGVEIGDTPTGHAIIEVDRAGDNRILVHGGANQELTRAHIDRVVASLPQGATLLLQNETNALPRLFERTAGLDLHLVLNPSPFDTRLLELDLERVGTFLVNETEAASLCGKEKPEDPLPVLRERFPKAAIVLTLGARGVRYADSSTDAELHVPAPATQAIDTTAAGDTFAGYFLAERALGRDTRDALSLACRAAAKSVERPGAAASIPWRRELS